MLVTMPATPCSSGVSSAGCCPPAAPGAAAAVVLLPAEKTELRRAVVPLTSPATALSKIAAPLQD
jgi:hypothetical protein